MAQDAPFCSAFCHRKLVRIPLAVATTVRLRRVSGNWGRVLGQLGPANGIPAFAVFREGERQVCRSGERRGAPARKNRPTDRQHRDSDGSLYNMRISRRVQFATARSLLTRWRERRCHLASLAPCVVIRASPLVRRRRPPGRPKVTGATGARSDSGSRARAGTYCALEHSRVRVTVEHARISFDCDVCFRAAAFGVQQNTFAS